MKLKVHQKKNTSAGQNIGEASLKRKPNKGILQIKALHTPKIQEESTEHQLKKQLMEIL